MTTAEFESFVESNARMELDDEAYNFVGLAGECGEVMEWFKKAELRKHKKDHKLTPTHLKLELGDVMHYVARIARGRGWTLDEVMEANVKKLEKRGEWS